MSLPLLWCGQPAAQGLCPTLTPSPLSLPHKPVQRSSLPLHRYTICNYEHFAFSTLLLFSITHFCPNLMCTWWCSWVPDLTLGLWLCVLFRVISRQSFVTHWGEICMAGRCDSALPSIFLLPLVWTLGFIERASDVQLNTCHSLSWGFQSPPFMFLAGCLLIYSLISMWKDLEVNAAFIMQFSKNVLIIPLSGNSKKKVPQGEHCYDLCSVPRIL